MLQIRLRKPAAEGGGSKPLPPDTVTVACPDHLVLADLAVAKSIGATSASAVTKIVGRRSRRLIGERVHFCVHCDLPVAVYGRLNPCNHIYCLDCARSESFCFICEERIQKIQTIKMLEGIYICAAPHCLKSFFKKSDFSSHVHQTHPDLINPGADKEGNDLELSSARKPAGSESTVQAPPRAPFPIHASSEAHRLPPTPRPIMPPTPRPMQAFSPQIHNHSTEPVIDTNAPPGFDRMVPLQSPNFSMPMMMNPGMSTPQYGYPQFFPDGSQQVFNAPPYDMSRPDPVPESGSGQGSLNFGGGYPRPSWNMGPGMGMIEQTPNMEGMMASPVNKGESGQSGASVAAFPPPSPFPLQLPQHNRGGQFYSDDATSDGQGFN